MKREGYVFSALLIVVTVIGIISTSFTGVAVVSDRRHREEELAFSLVEIKISLENYRKDEGEYPDDLSQLIEKGYLRREYREPHTRPGTSWKRGWEYDPAAGEIRSASSRTSLRGTPLSSWVVVENGGRYIINEAEEQ